MKKRMGLCLPSQCQTASRFATRPASGRPAETAVKDLWSWEERVWELRVVV